MPAIKCPDCGKSLKVGDGTAGKRVRCPGCKNPFVVPDDAPVLELVEEEEEQEEQEEQEERVTARPRREAERRPKARRDDEDEDEDEEEEEEERPRPRRRRSRNDGRRDISVSSAPLVYGIIACLLSCAPLIGCLLGALALSKANEEMNRLPGGRRADAARKQLQIARILGIIGRCLSFVMLLVAIAFKVMDAKK